MPGRPPLAVGTAGRIRVYQVAKGWRARTLVRDYDGQTRAVEATRKTRAAAERALAEAIRDRHRAGSSAEVTPNTRVSDLAEVWWAEVSQSAKSPTTLRLYRDRLDRQVVPSLGLLRVRELTTGTIDRHLRAVVQQHGPGTAKATRSVLAGLCGLAARHDAIERNPVRDVGSIPQTESRQPIALSVAEVRQLRALLTYDRKAVARDLPEFVDMMLATGLRIGECSAITWDAVDLDSGTVEIRGMVVRIRGIGLVIRQDASSKLRVRVLSLPSWAVSMLKHRFARRDLHARSPAVFPAPLGGLRDPSNTQADLRQAFEAAGFEITSHALRKTVATLMDESGLSARAGADQLGHSKPSMTADKYWGRKALVTGAAAVLEQLAE